MALIQEDGNGLANANTYASIAEADAYATQRGWTSWLALSSQDKEKHLLLAMDYMRARYRGKWRGTRIRDAMALDFPRYDLYDVDGYLVATNVVPADVKNSQIELAERSRTQSLIVDVAAGSSGALKSEIVEAGSVKRSREWFGGKQQQPTFTAVQLYLKPYLLDGEALVRG
ncbi:hypothetical protein [Caudoviricetes sp.]|nr:hypothetical protein [Caudoviricetes sp.]UOF82746.1 hypothetical protein [Caudoviricetes sp.]